MANVSAEQSYMASRTRKSAEQAGPVRTALFRGVVVWFNGRTGQYGRECLSRLLYKHGARVHFGPSRKVTHIIGINTSASKRDRRLKVGLALVGGGSRVGLH